MSHEHCHGECQHELKYCAVCDVVYCSKCGREWGKPLVTYPVPIVYPVYPSPVYPSPVYPPPWNPIYTTCGDTQIASSDGIMFNN